MSGRCQTADTLGLSFHVCRVCSILSVLTRQWGATLVMKLKGEEGDDGVARPWYTHMRIQVSNVRVWGSYGASAGPVCVCDASASAILHLLRAEM